VDDGKGRYAACALFMAISAPEGRVSFRVRRHPKYDAADQASLLTRVSACSVHTLRGGLCCEESV
jgi:hypothetical protein